MLQLNEHLKFTPMNENLDLTKILKDCPNGKKLYSPISGKVTFVRIEYDGYYPIIVEDRYGDEFTFSKDGKFYKHKDAECLLFPSKDNRDWSTFNNQI